MLKLRPGKRLKAKEQKFRKKTGKPEKIFKIIAIKNPGIKKDHRYTNEKSSIIPGLFYFIRL